MGCRSLSYQTFAEKSADIDPPRCGTKAYRPLFERSENRVRYDEVKQMGGDMEGTFFFKGNFFIVAMPDDERSEETG